MNSSRKIPRLRYKVVAALPVDKPEHHAVNNYQINMYVGPYFHIKCTERDVGLLDNIYFKRFKAY